MIFSKDIYSTVVYPDEGIIWFQGPILAKLFIFFLKIFPIVPQQPRYGRANLILVL